MGKLITSKEKALWQMDTINRLTERGEWFVGSEWHYEIQKDELNPVDGQPRFVRDIMIKCVETGGSRTVSYDRVSAE